MKKSLKNSTLKNWPKWVSWDPLRTPQGALWGLKIFLVAKNIYLHPSHPDQGQKSQKSRQIEFCHTLPIVLENCAVRVALWNFSVNCFLVYFWSTSSLAGSDTSLFIFPWLGLTQTTNKWDFRDWLPITFQAVNKAMFGWFDYFQIIWCFHKRNEINQFTTNSSFKVSEKLFS